MHPALTSVNRRLLIHFQLERLHIKTCGPIVSYKGLLGILTLKTILNSNIDEILSIVGNTLHRDTAYVLVLVDMFLVSETVIVRLSQRN